MKQILLLTFFCFRLNVVMLLRTSLPSSTPPGPLYRLAREARLFRASTPLGSEVTAAVPARSACGEPGGVEASLPVPSIKIH